MLSLINIFKALISSMSMLVPGISGGTTMIALGIYYPCLETLNNWTQGKFVNKKFMIELGIGSISGLLLFSKVISRLLTRNSMQLQYFFYGIILAGTIHLLFEIGIKKITIQSFLAALLGLLISLFMSYVNPAALIGEDIPKVIEILIVIVAGFVIAIALIMPGISTSFVLLVLGLYEETIHALESLNIAFLLPLVIGILIGVFVTTKVLSNALVKHEKTTKMTILGFVVGSMITIFPGLPTSNIMNTMIVPIALGSILLYLLNKMSFQLK